MGKLIQYNLSKWILRRKKIYIVEDSPALNNERYSLETTIVELISNKTSWLFSEVNGFSDYSVQGKKAGLLGVFHTRTQGTQHNCGVHTCPFTNCFPRLTHCQTSPHPAAPMTLECIWVIADLLMGRGSQRWCHYAIASGPVVQHAKHLIPSTRWEFTYKAMLHKIHQYKSLMEMNYSLQAIKILLMIRWRYLRLW